MATALNAEEHILPKDTILIDGAWRSTASGGTMEHVNPTTGRAQAKFAVGGAGEIDEAVQSAKRAFPAWRRVTADVRREILYRFAQLLRENADTFSHIAALESGAPIGSFNMIGAAIDHVTYAAGWVDKLEGQITPTYPMEALNLVHHEPYGVIGAITTWNGPVVTAAMKSAPALAAGNCVVIKPPELGPFGTALLGRIAMDAGIPPGVLNIVSGAAEAGEALVRHPDVGKVTFTGSVPIARIVLKAAAENITPVVLELGGKSANLVFEDADLDNAAIMAAQMSVVQTAGQGCLFPTRLLVHENVYDAVVERILSYVKTIRIGDPLDPATDMGPVISERAVNRIMTYIDGAKTSGQSRLLAGGNRVGGDLASGFFIVPTIFGEVEKNATIAREEIFGPVLSIMRFRTEEEALRIANDTPFGLAGFVHTNDLKRAHRVAAALEAGYVSINGFPPMAASTPFGGWKQSGYGREGGRIGIEEFLRPKNVHLPL